MLRPIIKNIVPMTVAGLQQIKRLWKNIMKKKQYGMVQKDYVVRVKQA